MVFYNAISGLLRWFLKVSLSLILLGCGGGGSSGGSSPPVNPIAGVALSGTVLIPDPSANSMVDVTCSGGAPQRVQTDINGKYSVFAPGVVPCRLETLTPKGLKLQSLALVSGTANLSLLTDMSVKLSHNDATKLAQVKTLMFASLPKWGIDLQVDPITTSVDSNPNGVSLRKSIKQYSLMEEQVPSLQLTQAGSVQDSSLLNLSIADQCYAQNISSSVTCVPVEAFFNTIDDIDIREIGKQVAEKLDKDLLFGGAGFSGIFGGSDLTNAEEAAVKKGSQYMLAIALKKISPFMTRSSFFKKRVGTPVGIRNIVNQLADDMKTDSPIKKFKSLSNTKGKIEFALDIFADILSKAISKQMLGWVVESDSSVEYIFKSSTYGFTVYGLNVTLKVLSTCLPHGLACLSSPVIMQSALLKSEVEVLIDVGVDYYKGFKELISTYRDIEDSIAMTNALSGMLEDEKETQDNAKKLLIKWLENGMVGYDAAIAELLDTSAFGKNNLRMIAIAMRAKDEDYERYLVKKQINNYEEIKSTIDYSMIICRAKGADVCLKALGHNTPVNIDDLYSWQAATGLPATGAFSLKGSNINLVRVHAGTSSSDTYCYQDLDASAGNKTFSFSGNWINENGRSCSTLLPAAGSSSTITFKIEARDSANNLANDGIPPYTTMTYRASTIPVDRVNVSDFYAGQSSADEAITGSFSVSGSNISLVRVHAGTSSSDTYCYQDLDASAGNKTFSFSGNWINENGRSCSTLLPAAGSSSTITFKIEARDSANNLANDGIPPYTAVTYHSAGTRINVSDFYAGQSSADEAITGSFSVSGSNISLVRVHAGTSSSDTYCYQDLDASAGNKTFSFSGNWINENGRSCSTLLPAAGQQQHNHL
jgi:hypothetical protein